MGIAVNFNIKLSWEDLRSLSPEQCEAVMCGIAKVVSANPDVIRESVASGLGCSGNAHLDADNLPAVSQLPTCSEGSGRMLPNSSPTRA